MKAALLLLLSLCAHNQLLLIARGRVLYTSTRVSYAKWSSVAIVVAARTDTRRDTTTVSFPSRSRSLSLPVLLIYT